MSWIEVSRERWDEMLCVLPPALWNSTGFLVGEACDHRVCKVTHQVRARYDALIEYKGKCWENTEPMTVPEFNAFSPDW
jgi:hypothetical protein